MKSTSLICPQWQCDTMWPSLSYPGHRYPATNITYRRKLMIFVVILQLCAVQSLSKQMQHKKICLLNGTTGKYNSIQSVLNILCFRVDAFIDMIWSQHCQKEAEGRVAYQCKFQVLRNWPRWITPVAAGVSQMWTIRIQTFLIRNGTFPVEQQISGGVLQS